jgi:hypothetical protein
MRAGLRSAALAGRVTIVIDCVLARVMQEHIKPIPVILPNGARIQVEARVPAERDVGVLDLAGVSLDALREAIEGLAALVNAAIQNVKPHKVTAEFAIELSYEAGKLTSLLVSGASKGSLKIGLEW